MPKKGRKATPAELDFLFARQLIDESEYRDFWGRWGKANAREREEIIESYLEEAADEEPEETIASVVTKNKKFATAQAKRIGGYVVRRNAKGQFSKRGKYYQAIRPGRKV